MRLLRTTDLTFEEFPGHARPPYAILSHTWEQGEVLYADIVARQQRKARSKPWSIFSREEEGKGKAGWGKIRGCAQTAKDRGVDYCWIDTCCIDKSSSTELSEAINSMYQWYRDADECLVYLSDMHKATLRRHRQTVASYGEALCKSKWFTRGWTLQEMIAPTELTFFDRDWIKLGTRDILAFSIEAFTGVPAFAYGKHSTLAWLTIDERLSWAEKRETTRPEDLVYCLMGIFNVSMSIIYGEGKDKAFRRLREEIRREDEHSLQAWADTLPPSESGEHPSDLAGMWRTVKAEQIQNARVRYAINAALPKDWPSYPMEAVLPTTGANGGLDDTNVKTDRNGSGRTAIATWSFEAVEPHDLAFTKGDLITITNSTDENWWTGINRRTKEQGLLPQNYVTLLPDRPILHRQTSTSVSDQPVADVIWVFEAIEEGDLTIRPGDLVSVIEKSDKGWWWGLNNRTDEVGCFPSTYVHGPPPEAFIAVKQLTNGPQMDNPASKARGPVVADIGARGSKTCAVAFHVPPAIAANRAVIFAHKKHFVIGRLVRTCCTWPSFFELGSSLGIDLKLR